MIQHTRLTVLFALNFTTVMPVFTATFLLVLLAAPVAADSDIITRLYLTGEIEKNLAIQADLTLNRTISGDTEITGSYFYERIGLPLQLKGRENQRGPEQRFTIYEFEQGTGQFYAQYEPGRQIFRGTWRHANVERERKFSLSAVAVYNVAERRLGERVTATVEYPTFFKSLPRHEQANTVIESSVLAAQKKFFESRRTDLLEIKDPQPHHRYGRDDRCEIAWYSQELLSLQWTVWEYTGGAHGNSWFQPINLRKVGNEWKELAPLDIFKLEDGSAVKALSDGCVAKLRKQEASGIVDDAEAKLDIKQLQQFTLSPAGITFHFAPYEVASYAEGAFHVMLDWKSLAEHVREDGPGSRWAKPG